MIIPAKIPQTRHDNNEGTRPPLIDADGIMRIDNSSFEFFTTCARSAEYYLVDRRHLAAERVALRTGGAVHIIMEILYRDFGGKPTDWNEFIQTCKASLFPYFEKYPPPPDDYRTLNYILDSMYTYLGFADLMDDFEIISGPSGPLIEQYFEYELGEVEFNSTYQGKYFGKIKVLWTGRIDMIIKRLGDYRILDHKTTTILGPNFFAEFMNSSPTIGYTWAAQKILNAPVAGLYLNAIAIRKPSKTGIPCEVQRRSYDYDKERIEEWHYNTLVLVSDFLSHLDRGYFPMQSKWCVGKYGPCQYLDVCTMPPSLRHGILQSNTYEAVTWNPKHGTNQ